jgi:Na+/H+ antiporter NhaD/arsenite permease-like protein
VHESLSVINPLGTWLAISLFVAVYLLIAFEHKSKIDKSGLALLAGSGMWLIAAIFSSEKSLVSAEIMHETQEIFSIVVFLLAAMTIVEVLLHYGLFDWIQQKIVEKKLSSAQLFWLLGLMTFLLSGILDNLTTTLIMIQIGRKIYSNKDSFIIFVAATVIAANAGGAFSPLGDVTTIMLWLAGKFSATEVIIGGFLPALATWLVPQYLLAKKIKTREEAEKEHKISKYEAIKLNKPVVALGLGSFIFPIVFSLIGLPPFMGLLLGVGILWIATDFSLKQKGDPDYSKKIISIVQKTDIATLKFFIGILLAVGSLGYMGVLDTLGRALFPDGSGLNTYIGGSVALGGISAILDNVPLVAAAIKIFPASAPAQVWVLLAITAGTGGSLFIIGSAAGVAAMGQAPEINFTKYLRIATVPALIGYILGVIVWVLQYGIFR